jgi:hypothetical protein
MCKKGQEINDVHNTMVQTIAAFCRSNGLHVRIETPNLFRSINVVNNTRPDLEIRGLEDIPILADVGVTFPITDKLSVARALVPGRAAAKYASSKIAKYKDSSTALNCSFIPFIFESRGHWDPAFSRFFKAVITHGSLVNNIPENALRIYWRRRLSMTLHKYVARCIIQKTKRLHAPSFHDESNWMGNVREQAFGLVDIVIGSNSE